MNTIKQILKENIQKNNKKLSKHDLDMICSNRFSLSIEEYKDIFSSLENIQLLDISYKDGAVLETIFMICNKLRNQIHLTDTYDYFFSQIEKANSTSEILSMTLNNTLLNSTAYNNLITTQYFLTSEKLPFKASIEYANYGSLFNAYSLYKKDKKDVFLYLIQNFDFSKDSKFIKASKKIFKDQELKDFLNTIHIFQNFKDLKNDLENDFNQLMNSSQAIKKNKI